MEAKKKIPITLITGNKKKLEEFMAIMSEDLAAAYDVRSMAIDLDELQGEPEFIASRKAKLATHQVPTPVIVDDVSLCFNALKGLPGPYIKSFLDKIGRQGLVDMLKGFDDKTGYAQCIYAYCESPETEPVVFIGKCDGQIVSPRGENMFGWDPIFLPNGHEQTFAEMDMEVKNKISHRGMAGELIKDFLRQNAERLSEKFNQ
eukprot:403352150